MTLFNGKNVTWSRKFKQYKQLQRQKEHYKDKKKHKKGQPPLELEAVREKDGGYLLSHLAGSTIGVAGLNFSVRDGKRWNPGAVATLCKDDMTLATDGRN